MLIYRQLEKGKPKGEGRKKQMTINKLIRAYEATHNGFFFSKDTLKFFGEAVSRMRVLKKTTKLTDISGDKHTCYVVSSTRTKDAFGKCKPYVHYHYFDTTTLDHIIL